jgi:hypothetical protein
VFGALIFGLLRNLNPTLPDQLAPIEAKIKVTDVSGNQPARAPSAARQPEISPSAPVVAAKGAMQKTGIANAGADNAVIQDHIKRAKSLREQGEYANASRELEKARAIAPDNRAIRAEIENVKKACNTEREILGQTSLNCG